MKWWPFAKETMEVVEPASEPSTIDRMLAKKCSRDEFSLLYLKLLQESVPDQKFEMASDMEIKIVNAEGKEATTHLHNLWIAYSRGDADRREILERFVSTIPKLTYDSPPLAKQQIVVLVKDAEYLATLPKFSITDHFCGDLWLVFAQDLPDRMITMKLSQLDEFEIEKAGLLPLALENLTRIMPSAEQNGDGPWYWLSAGGDYEASLLLFDAVWDQLAQSVDGEIVAAVPARDTLVFTGSNSAEGLKAIKDQAAHVVKTGNYVVSETLIIRRGGKWEVFNAN
jgi:hypothetical protein